MLPLILISLLSVLAQVALGGDDAWFHGMVTLANEQLDPIVNPNGLGTHMHKIGGGSAFGASFSYESARAGSCSTVFCQADKSNYWMPNLFWVDHAINKFIPLQANIRFYYFLSRNSPNQTVSPFPPGLRMVIGSAENRAPTQSATFTCQTTLSDQSQFLSLDNFNFPRDCPYGLKTELFFQQCWDGVNLYKSDNSHMSYPINGNVRDGSCPLSHPVRIPSILLEYTWLTQNYAPGTPLAGNLVWASGDSTGYGIHGDFTSGWDPAVLGAALNSTACGIGGGAAVPLESCPILNQYVNVGAATACKPDKGVLANPGGNSDLQPLNTLPGCLPSWGSVGTTPMCNNAVQAGSVGAFSGSDGAYSVATPQNFVLPTTPGWKSVACLSTVGVTGGPSYTDASVNQDTCQASCFKQGFPYASIGQIGTSWSCYCGSGLDMSAPTYPDMCNTACPGNATQTCGGQRTFQVFYAPAGTVAGNATLLAGGGTAVGCYNNPSTASAGLLGAATYSFSSTSMTTETCLAACKSKSSSWAATTAGIWCYCGTSWNMGTGSLVPSSQCTKPCQGNATEICGDQYRSSVYNITGVAGQNSTAYHAAGWQSCYQEGTGKSALADNVWSSTALTSDLCVNGCSELGYDYAGTEAGSRCYCGNTFQGGQALPDSQCTTPCSGNSSQPCGGANTLDLYKTDQAKVTPESIAATKPTGYAGCWYNAGSTTYLNDYTYTSNSMTPPLCQSACAGFGYPYSGVQAGTQCRCGKAPPVLQVVSANCAKTCGGDSWSTCGGNGYLELYNTSTIGSQYNSTYPANSTTGAASNTSTVGSTSYLNCYSDSPVGLTGFNWANPNMSNDMCRTGCAELGYSLAGTKSGTLCFCGNSYTGGQILPASSCNTACPGNSAAQCGGAGTISIYKTAGAAAPPTPPANYQGCYQDVTTARVLSGYQYSANPMSAHACQVACAAQGFALAGTEVGNQCFCGAALAAGTKRTASAQCNSPCLGTTSGEMCGGSGYLSVYNATTATVSNGIAGYRGCYTDYSTLSEYTMSSTLMSVDICTTLCSGRGYAYAGLYKGNQCKCGNTAPKQTTTSATCVSPCSGNSTQNCGTATGVAVYSVADSSAASSSTFALSTNSSGFAGCFTDSAGSRVFPYMAVSSNALTNSMCASNCKALGYAYAGSENGVQCFCGNNIPSNGTNYQVAATDCAVKCAGGTGTDGLMCGGNGRISILDTTKFPAVAAFANGQTGCYAPGTMSSGQLISLPATLLTPDLCAKNCATYGAKIAGIFNGNKCYCATSKTYGDPVAPALCSAPCVSTAGQTCSSTASTTGAMSVWDASGPNVTAPASGTPANYVGCFIDTSVRQLSGYVYSNPGMTSLQCGRTCQAQNFTVWGTEQGNLCYCGNALPVAGILPDNQCSTPCTGLASEMCGGSYKISVYQLPKAAGSPSGGASAPASSSAGGGLGATPPAASSSSAGGGLGATPPPASSSASKASSVSASPSPSSASPSPSKASSSSAAPSPSSASPSPSKASSSSAAAASSSSASPSPSKASSSSAAPSPSSSSASPSPSKPSSSSAAPSPSSSSASPSPSKASSSSAAAPSSSSASPSPSKASSSSAAAPSSSSASPSPSKPSSSSAAPSSSSSASKTSSSAAASSSSAAASSSTSKPASSSVAPSSTSSSFAAASTDPAYVGCYTEPTLVFGNNNVTAVEMTQKMCKIWCNANSFTYAGVTQGAHCACSNTLDTLTQVSGNQCAVACVGNQQQKCGGLAAWIIFKSAPASAAKRSFHSPDMRLTLRSRKQRIDAY